MKRILIFCTVLLATSIEAQEIKWLSFDEALSRQAEEPKKIIVDVYTKWCGPCKLLDKNTFKNKQVARFINDNYYAVKFDAEGTASINYKDKLYTNPQHDPKRKGRNAQHQFAGAMGINAYPSIVFFDEQGNFIQPVVGYKTPAQLEIYLKMIANDDYKTLTTEAKWRDYQANFSPTFSK